MQPEILRKALERVPNIVLEWGGKDRIFKELLNQYDLVVYDETIKNKIEKARSFPEVREAILMENGRVKIVLINGESREFNIS